MIYLDNAATTLVKPPQVARAVQEALQHFGGAGRSVHSASLSADETVYECRIALARLFGEPHPERVCFTLNITQALNMVIAGLLRTGDHVITTAAAHNSVLRPVFAMRDSRCVEVSVVPVLPTGELNYKAYEQAFKKNTRLVVLPHASNVTGDVYDIDALSATAHEHGALVCVDAAQTAGVLALNLADSNIDFLAFTGHKSLYGPQGTGGLVCHGDVLPHALFEGGTGTRSFSLRQPHVMPEYLEAGTLNAHGLAGLLEGARFIEQRGVSAIEVHISQLAHAFRAGISPVDKLHCVGGGSACGTCGIVAITCDTIDASTLVFQLSQNYDIATRAGAHCAPLMHKALGVANGIVRFSFSSFTSHDDIDAALRALRSIVAE